MALEVFILIFTHHRLARARVAFPVDALQRVTRPVIAQADELFRVADVRRQRHAARLITARTRQRNRWQRVAARQHQYVCRCVDSCQSAHQAQRIGARHGDALKMLRAAPQGLCANRHLQRAARRERRQRSLIDLTGFALVDEPLPFKIRGKAHARTKLRQRRARISEIVDQRKPVARRVRVIVKGDAVSERLAGSDHARQVTRCAETSALQQRGDPSDENQRSAEREYTIRHRELGIHTERGGGDHRATHQHAGAREATFNEALAGGNEAE